MIDTTKRLWKEYETNFHLAWVNRNYKNLTWQSKLLALVWKLFYWMSNASFSLIMFIPELLIITLIKKIEQPK